jgi:RAD51-like protein 2
VRRQPHTRPHSHTRPPFLSSLPPFPASQHPAYSVLRGGTLSRPSPSPPSPRHVVTFCQELDGLLSGGVPVGAVTEVAGGAGTGKTTLAMQLALDTRLPREIGGCAGEALLIDTEGGVFPARLAALASAVQGHVQSVLRKKGAKVAGAAGAAGGSAAAAERLRAMSAACEVDALLSGIFIHRVTSPGGLAEAIAGLPAFLAPSGRGAAVRLVVIDSIAFHLRYGPDAAADAGVRQRAMAALGGVLNRIAAEADVALVVTNQVTTRPGHPGSSSGGAGGGSRSATASRVVPALGEGWAHTAAVRLQLGWDTRPDSPHAGARIATLPKGAAMRAPGVAYYAICADGVRGTAVAARAAAAGGGGPK